MICTSTSKMSILVASRRRRILVASTMFTSMPNAIFATSLEKIPSEMEVAPRYTLSTLFTLFTLSILFEVLYTAYACMPRYILFGKVRTLLEWWASAQIVGWVDGWWKDTPETLKTIRAPVVLKMTGSAMPKIYMFSKFIKICQGLLLATLAALKLCSYVSKKSYFSEILFSGWRRTCRRFVIGC